MKTIKMSVGERLAINNLLNGVKGGLSVINMAFKVMDRIEFKEVEAKMIEMKTITSPQGTPQLNWNDKRAKDKEIEFSDDQVTLIKDEIKTKSEAGELTTADRYILSLAEKLDIDIGGEKSEEKSEKKDK